MVKLFMTIISKLNQCPLRGCNAESEMTESHKESSRGYHGDCMP